MTRWLRLPAALFAFALLFAACGDDSGDDSTATGSGSDTPSNDYGGGGSDSGDCASDVCAADLAFSPDSVTVQAGDTVEWANQDGTTHTVTADDDSFDSGDLPAGDTFSFTFDSAGEFTYHCEIHSSMTGTVVVE